MSALLKPAGVMPAPKGAGLLLACAVPLELVAAFVSLFVAVAVAPLLDFTPIVALWVALGARRWAGAPARVFGSVIVLSVVMLVEWVAWLGPTLGEGVRGSGAVATAFAWVATFLSLAYPLEMAALLVLTAVACAMTYVGVRRTRAAAAEVAAG